MSDISRTLFPHDAISIEGICTQVPEERRISNFSDALVILQRLLTEDAIHVYITKSYPGGEAIELQDKAALLEYHNIEPNVGCSINMLFDADSGDYNNAETLLHRIRNDDFLNTLRFSKNEVAASFKDMALLMMPVVSNGENKADRKTQQPSKEVQEPILSTEEIVTIWKRAIKKHASRSRQLNCALMRWLCRQDLDDGAGKEESLAAEYGKPRQTIHNWEKKGLTEGKRLGLPPLL